MQNSISRVNYYADRQTDSRHRRRHLVADDTIGQQYVIIIIIVLYLHVFYVSRCELELACSTTAQTITTDSTTASWS